VRLTLEQFGVAVVGMLTSRDVRTPRHKLPEPAPVPMEESVA
jgi:hypothetical protein